MGSALAEISVIVLTYNQEDTIARALDSILCQKIDVPYEILIADDASTDTTPQICRQYADRYPDRIRFFRRERNLGLVKNYFQCIEDCRANLIADCAGDDFWVDPLKLQKEYSLMKAYPDTVLVHTAWLDCDPDGSNPRLSEASKAGSRLPYTPMVTGSDPEGSSSNASNTQSLTIPKGGTMPHSAVQKNTLTAAILQHRPEARIHLCTALYRRDLVIKWMRREPELFNSEIYRCEDLQIITLLSTEGTIRHIPDVTLYYTVAPDSISHNTDFAKMSRQVMSNLRLTEHLRRILHITPDLLLPYFDVTFGYLCSQVIYSGDKSLRTQYFALAAYCPQTDAKVSKARIKRAIKETILKNDPLWALYRFLIRKGASR